MTDYSVVIAGGGPTGLMLAAELALAGVDGVVVERRPNQEHSGARALGISSRTIEVLDQRGIADRFLSAGQVAQVIGFAATGLDISDFPTRHNYGLALRQKHIERILVGWVTELKVPILYGREITGFAQHDTGVDVALADGRSLRAQYLVGCDGGRSLIRKTAGIDFPGWDPTTSSILAEAPEQRQASGVDQCPIHRKPRLGVTPWSRRRSQEEDCCDDSLCSHRASCAREQHQCRAAPRQRCRFSTSQQGGVGIRGHESHGQAMGRSRLSCFHGWPRITNRVSRAGRGWRSS